MSVLAGRELSVAWGVGSGPGLAAEAGAGWGDGPALAVALAAAACEGTIKQSVIRIAIRRPLLRTAIDAASESSVGRRRTLPEDERAKKRARKRLFSVNAYL